MQNNMVLLNHFILEQCGILCCSFYY